NTHARFERKRHAAREHEVVDEGFAREKIVFTTHEHGRALGVDLRDERRLAERDAEPFALPDRETMKPFVLSDDASGVVDDRSWTRTSARALRSEEHTSELQSLTN